MKETELIKEIQKGCQFLIDDRYIFNRVEENILYQKKMNNGGFSIDLRYFEWTNSSYRIDAFKISKRFNAIETEIQKVLGGSLDDYTIYTLPKLDKIPDDIEHAIYNNHIEFIVKDVDDITKVIFFLKTFYYETAIPFFEKYKTIYDVNQKLSSLDRNEVTSFITNDGNTVFYRELTIKYLTNSPDFEEYYAYILKEFETVKGQETFDEIVQNLKKIKQNLVSNLGETVSGYLKSKET
jgi:hypothetical protein